MSFVKMYKTNSGKNTHSLRNFLSLQQTELGLEMTINSVIIIINEAEFETAY